jgi:hypothetical protein
VTENPFDSIESAHEYVHLLRDALDETHATVRQDIAGVTGPTEAERRLDALRLVDYKLDQLRAHITAAGRLLNDLRTLRRLLLSERDERAKRDADGRERL